MKSKVIKSIVPVFITVFCFQDISAQDLHFSQYYNSPLVVNPAQTGVFNGKVRGIAIYRDQWSSLAPFKTYGLSIDAGIMKRKLNDAFIGTGLNVYQDEAGDSKLSTTQVNLSLASVISINSNNSVSAGIQGGLVQKKINNGDLHWGTQYDGEGYAPNMTSGESPVFENSTVGDFSIGLAWSYVRRVRNISSNNGINASAGFAVHHLNAPKQAFDKERLHRNFITHARMSIGIKGTPFAVNPSLLYMQQGPLKEINAGGLVRYMIIEESKYTGNVKETAIFLGAFYRVGDAIVPTFMFEHANYALGVSYDINSSGLSKATKGKGGVELTFRYINSNSAKRRTSLTNHLF
ncbi:MAG TPA: type IX secretion system membrane protein PorP/SprF [Flavobacteriales bacterium]|nr:type IX secretion system membrane protein PorP/SprF [Flavobacteriales bacterium]HIO68879.1 type IX secretion system membrane protein PorP/SprF [Flavobacteriales bacterium]